MRSFILLLLYHSATSAIDINIIPYNKARGRGQHVTIKNTNYLYSKGKEGFFAAEMHSWARCILRFGVLKGVGPGDGVN